MNPNEKLLLAYVANLQVQIDLLDELRLEPYYKQKIKNISNSVLKEAETVINKLYENMNEEAELEYNKAVGISESFINAVRTCDLNILKELLEELVNGNVYATESEEVVNNLTKVK